jgi:hypothetical protein
MPARPQILVISFSTFVSDARVLRQLNVVRDFGAVTTVGFGPKPEAADEHIELDASLKSLPQTVSGVAKLALHRFRSVALEAPATAAALSRLAGRRFDLVIANEARALPLAHAVNQGAPVWGDMHEWAPEERTNILSWRLLVAPFMRWVCATYLPMTQAVTTVNGSIARLYDEQFGVNTEVVRNAISLQDLRPSAVDDSTIRLVHSGAAVPGRSLETLINATIEAGERFTLDLYLMKAGDGGSYWEQLRSLSARSSRVTFHEPVAPQQLPATLNGYDIGIMCLEPKTTNHRFMLPNKFFDFVQARLGVVFSPAVETSALIEKYGLGLVTDGFTVGSLVEALRSITRDDVLRFKANADVAAPLLSSTQDEEVQRGILGRLLSH